MDLDDITEFTELDPQEIHLVSTPASKYSPVVAKAREELDAQVRSGKEGRMKKKLRKALTRAGIAHVDAERIVRRLTTESADPRSGGRAIAGWATTIGSRSAFKELDRRVVDAQAALAAAPSNTYQETAAKDALRAAQRTLMLAKMIAAENARANDPRMLERRLSGRGVPLFSNRHELDDDDDLRYVGGTPGI